MTNEQAKDVISSLELLKKFARHPEDPPEIINARIEALDKVISVVRFITNDK